MLKLYKKKISKGPKHAQIIPNFKENFTTTDSGQYNRHSKIKLNLNLGKKF